MKRKIFFGLLLPLLLGTNCVPPASGFWSFELVVIGPGIVEGSESGEYEHEKILSFTAIPDEDCQFDGWFFDDLLLSLDLTYSFPIIVNATLTAKFSEIEVVIPPDPPSPPELIYERSYGHVYHQTDFIATGGSKTINGVEWLQGSLNGAHLGGADKGVQLGSKNHPLRIPMTLSTTFPSEVIITGVSFNWCVANGGNADATIAFGEYSETIKTRSTISEDYVSEEGLAIPASSLSFTLQQHGSAAIYFYSLYFNIIIPEGIEYEISHDVFEAKEIVPGVNGIPAINYQPIAIDDYYAGVNITATGETLRTALRSKLQNMTKVSYGNAQTMLQYADENITEKGWLYGMWDGDKIFARWDSGSTWQREHVWACAAMKPPTGEHRPSESTRNHTSDLHNLRVACPSTNGNHGNSYLDLTTVLGTSFFPNASNPGSSHANSGDHRGDAARIFFYQYTHYDWLKLSDTPWENPDVTMGKLSLLKEWHEADPVDAFEIQRNNRIYAYQGNRNPFIDHPEIALNLFN